MVATSHHRATRAGLRAIERGGNAVDAALAAAAVLCVAEPMATGVGGDAFALVRRDGSLYGLDAAGPAPRDADPAAPVAQKGPRSVTVPGAVAGWVELAERFGRFGLDSSLADAVDAAERGIAVGSVTASAWARSEPPPELQPARRAGERFRWPELATTLRAIAAEGPDAVYRGPIARGIAGASWLGEDDLAEYRPRWVEPLTTEYRGVTVAEMPPPTQGVAALEALALLDRGSPALLEKVECVRLALADAFMLVRDGADVTSLLEPGFLARRRAVGPPPAREPRGGTVYLCAVDGDGTSVSFAQSLYEGFGSGVVVPGTGVLLQNRGACFAVNGRVEPGRRPYHTVIPGMLLGGVGLSGPFGVMGGFVQAQAHLQVVSALVDEGLDPQAALERPRFRVEGDSVLLEEGLWDAAAELEAVGIPVVRSSDASRFGGGQAILASGEALIGGSDPRKDGCALGI
jgi:gamma-glutamyltranspeptidase / glutathione hydrolase